MTAGPVVDVEVELAGPERAVVLDVNPDLAALDEQAASAAPAPSAPSPLSTARRLSAGSPAPATVAVASI